MSAKTGNEKKLVILVDDNPATLQSGLNVLSVGYRVATAPSGVKLFELLEKNTPDIIILDIDMPELDGYQVIKVLKFRPDTKDIPVIFLTGKTDPGDEIVGLSLGAVDYITKPFQPSLLLKRTEMHLLMAEQKKKLEKQSVELHKIIDMQTVLANTLTNITRCRSNITEDNLDNIHLELTNLLEKIETTKLTTNN